MVREFMIDNSIKENTQPGIFHIHIDAQNMPAVLDEFSIKLGFENSDFNGHPKGYPHFEPKRHLTLKVRTKEEFNIIWKKLECKVNECSDFKGYLEGEFVPSDEFIPY